jgi:hypothetical protein
MPSTRTAVPLTIYALIGLRGWTVRRSNPGRDKFYSLLPNFQAASGAHASSYLMGTEVLYPGGGKAARAYRPSFTYI